MRNYRIRLLPWVVTLGLLLLRVSLHKTQAFGRGSESATPVSRRDFPRSPPFPPEPPRRFPAPFGPSLVLWQSLTSRWRSCQDYTPLAFPDRSAQTARMPCGISRFSCMKFWRMLPGLRLRQARRRLAHSDASRVAFPLRLRGRRLGKVISELNTGPAPAPVNASPTASRL